MASQLRYEIASYVFLSHLFFLATFFSFAFPSGYMYTNMSVKLYIRICTLP